MQPVNLNEKELNYSQKTKSQSLLNELFQSYEQEPSLQQLREIEFLLSSAYRGYGTVVAHSRNKNSITLKQRKSTSRVLIDATYVAELAGMFLPFYNVKEHVPSLDQLGTPSKHAKGTPEGIEQNQPDLYTPQLLQEEPALSIYGGSTTDVKDVETASRFFSTVGCDIPMTVAFMFMNLGCIEDNGRCVPNYVNQPDVNNRRINVSDIYNADNVAKENRETSEYGTIETAWGDSNLSMHAANTVVWLYEAHTLPDGSENVRKTGLLKPCLESIPSGTPLVGDPYADPVTLEAACSLFQLFTEKHPEVYFPDEFSDKNKDEASLAHRIACSAIFHLRVKFKSLRTTDSWIELYDFLRDALNQKLSMRDSHPADKTWESKSNSFLDQFQKRPTAEVTLRKHCWLMMNAITPIRIGILDGQRRFSGAIYALLNRLPETSISELSRSLDESSGGMPDLIARKNPSMAVLSKWMSVKFVRPVLDYSGIEDGHLESRALLLLKKHSEQIQHEVSSARKRSFKDVLVQILSNLESNDGLNLLVTGELKQRLLQNRKKDKESNDENYVALFNHVIHLLFNDKAKSVESLVHQGKKGITFGNNATQAEKAKDFVFKNHGAIWGKKTPTLLLQRKPLRTRSELNTIAMLVANFVHDNQSLNSLCSAIQMKEGNRVDELHRRFSVITVVDDDVSLSHDGKKSAFKVC